MISTHMDYLSLSFSLAHTRTNTDTHKYTHLHSILTDAARARSRTLFVISIVLYSSPSLFLIAVVLFFFCLVRYVFQKCSLTSYSIIANFYFCAHQLVSSSSSSISSLCFVFVSRKKKFNHKWNFWMPTRSIWIGLFFSLEYSIDDDDHAFY